MLLPYKKIFDKHPIILGSSSASRKHLFSLLNVPFKTMKSNFPQDLIKSSFKSPKQYCQATCDGKAQDILNQIKFEDKKISILVVADTIAAVDGQILQKPRDQQHCIQMLKKLSNRWHQGITAHHIYVGDKLYKFTTIDKIKMLDLDQQTLREFAKSEQPYSNSGGYRLQGLSGSFFDEINGSVSFQGLHTGKVCEAIIKGLKQMGWS